MPNKKSRPKTIKARLFKRVRKFSTWQLILFMVIFAAVGGYAVYRSFAATVTPDVSHIGSNYTNPFRSVSGFHPERIDQGVDYGGTGSLFAIGAGTVKTYSNSAGWPGKHFIAYKLSAGPAGGLWVYVAEDCTLNSNLKVGSSVTSSTKVCTMYNGGNGIETGWANRSGKTISAAGGPCTNDGATTYGKNFSRLMSSIKTSIQGQIGQSTGSCSTPVAPNPPYHQWAP